MHEAFEAAVRLLARREHSAYELQNKLKQRGFSKESVEEALSECRRLDLQCDVRFAEMFCRARVSRGYGPVVIRQLLRQVGVLADSVELALQGLDVNWSDEIERVWHKKFRAVDDVSLRARQKQWQFLTYRGFTEATIRAFFETLAVDDEIM